MLDKIGGGGIVRTSRSAAIAFAAFSRLLDASRLLAVSRLPAPAKDRANASSPAVKVSTSASASPESSPSSSSSLSSSSSTFFLRRSVGSGSFSGFAVAVLVSLSFFAAEAAEADVVFFVVVAAAFRFFPPFCPFAALSSRFFRLHCQIEIHIF